MFMTEGGAKRRNFGQVLKAMWAGLEILRKNIQPRSPPTPAPQLPGSGRHRLHPWETRMSNYIDNPTFTGTRTLPPAWTSSRHCNFLAPAPGSSAGSWQPKITVNLDCHLEGDIHQHLALEFPENCRQQVLFKKAICSSTQPLPEYDHSLPRHCTSSAPCALAMVLLISMLGSWSLTWWICCLGSPWTPLLTWPCWPCRGRCRSRSPSSADLESQGLQFIWINTFVLGGDSYQHQALGFPENCSDHTLALYTVGETTSLLHEVDPMLVTEPGHEIELRHQVQGPLLSTPPVLHGVPGN